MTDRDRVDVYVDRGDRQLWCGCFDVERLTGSVTIIDTESGFPIDSGWVGGRS